MVTFRRKEGIKRENNPPGDVSYKSGFVISNLWTEEGIINLKGSGGGGLRGKQRGWSR